jgi:hypothetical protein
MSPASIPSARFHSGANFNGLIIRAHPLVRSWGWPVKLDAVRSLLPIILLLWAAPVAVVSQAQPAPAAPSVLTPPQAQALVKRALAAELLAAQDATHPMRYRLRKSSPRFTSSKEIVETKDGDVARLLSIDDQPLSTAQEQAEQARLDELSTDPGRQRHRKQSEDEDTSRALKVLRALPKAFLYQFAGTAQGPTGSVDKFTFKPNPNFTPPDLETQALTEMTGELWIDTAQERVTRLEGHLRQDVDFGWGILGRLNKGGWIAIDQADVGGNQWRIVRFEMVMSGRVLLKNKSFDTVEEETRFIPQPVGQDYKQAIQMLRAGAAGTDQGVQ